jgi:hypothetical protein
MIRAIAFVAILVALLFLQFIGAAHQPTAGRSAEGAQPEATPTTALESDQRALEELAAWPVAAGR